MRTTEQTLRLQTLYDHMKAEGPDHFDMAYWLRNPADRRHSSLDEIQDWAAYPCGTTACIAGSAVAIMPELRDLVHTSPRGYYNDDWTTSHEIIAPYLNVSPHLFYAHHWEELDIYQRFFDLPEYLTTYEQALELLDLLIRHPELDTCE